MIHTMVTLDRILHRIPVYVVTGTPSTRGYTQNRIHVFCAETLCYKFIVPRTTFFEHDGLRGRSDRRHEQYQNRQRPSRSVPDRWSAWGRWPWHSRACVRYPNWVNCRHQDHQTCFLRIPRILEPFHSLEDRFAREAEAGARMGVHPNIVAVHDLVIDPGSVQYLILEYVDGGTVADRIARGPVPLGDALSIIADAAAGLQAAHERGIVHRDVKPSNLFLTEDGQAKLGDFGVAQIDDLSRRTQATTSHPGTPLYMSPEQAHATGYVRPSSDQYSLGLVLFEMLTGKAFKRQKKPEANALLAAQPGPVRALVARLLAEDPAARYSSMLAVQTALRALGPDRKADTGYSAELTIQSSKATVGSAMPPPKPANERRITRRALRAGGGGLALAAGGVGIAWATLRGASPPAVLASPTRRSTTSFAAGSTLLGPTASAIAKSSTATNAPTATGNLPVDGTRSAVQAAVSSPSNAAVPAATSITSLLSYLDGKVTLPGEPSDYSGGKLIFPGSSVTVVGLDLSRNQPIRLPAVTAPTGSRVIRTLWAPHGNKDRYSEPKSGCGRIQQLH